MKKKTTFLLSVIMTMLLMAMSPQHLWADTQQCLTFTASSAKSTVRLGKAGSPYDISLIYSTDGGSTWTEYTIGDIITLTNAGDAVQFKAGTSSNTTTGTNSGFSKSTTNYYRFVMVGGIVASGNVMSLLDATMSRTTMPNYGFNQLFYNCTQLKKAPELPATTVGISSYNQMFYGCKNLTTAPDLPATTLEYMCYNQMFYGCTSLTTAPDLPATTLATMCYYQMFYGCTSLTTAPELPATTLTSYCYYQMFNGCTSLTAAPELPATTLTDNCYYQMFQGCTSLTKAPELLPATTLPTKCYYNMFQDCTSLTTAPELPATTLVDYCYWKMFYGCTSLTTAPKLPATTLTKDCYYYMFEGCTSLTTAPELPATTLATDCYHNMFYGCTNLNYIKVSFSDWNSSNSSTSYWVNNVASTGTFVCPAGLDVSTTGVSNVPSGWTIVTFDEEGTLAKAGLGTYCSDKSFTVTGATPYIVTSINDSYVTISPVSGRIPANTGIILVGDEGDNYQINYTTNGDAAAVDGNLLLGTTERTSASVLKGSHTYLMALNGKAGEFQSYTGEYFPANRAYLLDDSTSGAKSLIFSDETTGITTTGAANDNDSVMKFVKDGKLYIRRCGNLYNAQGVKIQ